MKILLIYPPDIGLPGEEYFTSFPLGLGYLAAVLEKAGHEVVVLDALIEGADNVKKVGNFYHIGLSWPRVKGKIRKIKPDLVGISCLFTSQSRQMHRAAAVVKSVNTGIPVVVGGSHPTNTARETLRDENIDYVVLGEGEITFPKLASCLEKKKPVSEIDGLAFRKNKLILENPKAGFVTDLDSLPFPAWHLFPMKKYFTTMTRTHARFQKRWPAMTLITSRGCPFDCTFCSIHQIWGYQWRPRDPYKVVDEIEELVKKYGIREIHFEDDNLTINKKRMEKICDEIIRRKLDITWTTPNGVRIDTLDEPLLRKMKESGCYALFLGIESGNSYVRNTLMNKGLSLKKIRKIVALNKKLGIKQVGFFILGMPGEKKKHLQDTLRLVLDLDLDDVFLSIASPYPGTKLYKKCLENNWLVNQDLTTVRPIYGNIQTKYLSPRQVQHYRNMGYLRYELAKLYRHPRRFLTDPHQRTKIRKYLKHLLKTGT